MQTPCRSSRRSQEADTLSEAQIQRYGRQILLGPVGGRGQEALLAAPAQVHGLPVTAAYLAAGGTPVQAHTLPVNALDLVEGAQVQLDANGGFVASGILSELNPDADSTLPLAGTIARVPFEFSRLLDRAVAVGSQQVVFRNAGCADCFSATIAALKPGAPSVAVEALAALAWHRMVLGLATPLGTLRLDGLPSQIVCCEAHR